LSKPAVITIYLNPTLQKTLVFQSVVPNTVNRSSEYRLDASGKGINVSRVLTQLGRENIHLTQLGGCFRPLFLELCAKDKLAVKWVESYSEIRFCYTVIDKEKCQATELVEEGKPVGEGTGEKLLGVLDTLLPEYTTLVISGTAAPGFSSALIPEIVNRAKQNGLFIVLDIRGQDLLNSLPYKPDIIKPNLDEFITTFAPELHKDPFVIKDVTTSLCRKIHMLHGCHTILTRGSQNLWFSYAGGFEEFPVETIPAVNPIGSGDAFTAGLINSLLDSGLNDISVDLFRDALAAACHCGKLNSMYVKPGVIRA